MTMVAKQQVTIAEHVRVEISHKNVNSYYLHTIRHPFVIGNRLQCFYFHSIHSFIYTQATAIAIINAQNVMHSLEMRGRNCDISNTIRSSILGMTMKRKLKGRYTGCKNKYQSHRSQRLTQYAICFLVQQTSHLSR